MSGGSYDDLYRKMQEASIQLRRKDQPVHIRAFGDLMLLCAKAMHDIEWVESGDKSRGEEITSVMACIGNDKVLKVAFEDAERARDQLIELLAFPYKDEGV